MIKQTLMAAAVAAALAVPGTASAVTDIEMKELREQVQQMKREYEQRIEALEKRLQQAEGKTQKAEDAAVKAEGVASGSADAAAKAEERSVKAESAAVQASIRPASEGAFNPAVSVILNGVYGNLSQDPARYQISGFTPTGGDVGPGKRGLSLGESELALAAKEVDRHRSIEDAQVGQVGAQAVLPLDGVDVAAPDRHVLGVDHFQLIGGHVGRGVAVAGRELGPRRAGG